MSSTDRERSFYLFTFLFIGVIAYSVLMLGWITRKIGGGPCNGGLLTFFFIIPALLILFITLFFQLISTRKLLKENRPYTGTLLSIILPAALWIGASLMAMPDAGIFNAMIYFLPLLIYLFFLGRFTHSLKKV